MALRNPDPYEKHYSEEFEHGKAARNLQKNEAAASGGFDDKNTDIKSLEAQGVKHVNKFTGGQRAPKNQGFIKNAANRTKNFMLDKKKGPSLLVITMILGFLGFNMFSALPFGAIAAISNLSLDINDVAPTSRVRGHSIIGKKFLPGLNEPISAMCAVPGSVKCKYSTMSQTMVDRYAKVGIIIEGEPTGFLGRVEVTGINAFGESYSPSEFEEARNSRDGRSRLDSIAAADRRAHSMGWLGHHGPNFHRKVLGRWGLNMKPPTLQGTPQERALQLIARSGGSSLNDVSFSPALDANDNPIMVADEEGNLKQMFRQDGDPNQTLYSESQKNSMEKTVRNMRLVNTPVARRTFQTVSAFGIADIGCDIINTVGKASVAAKVMNEDQLSTLAMEIVPAVGALKAGDLSAEEAETLGNFFFATDNRETIWGVADDGENSGKEVEIPNPDYGKNALDSELFKMSTNGGVAAVSATRTGYSLGFGVSSALSGAAWFASTAQSFTTIPEVLGSFSTCGFIQSGAMRAIGLVTGVVGAFFTGGTNLALQGAGMIVFIVAAHKATGWLNSFLSMDLITEEINEASVERGDALWTGLAAVESRHAQSRGMIPGTAEELVAYQVERNNYRQEYIALERQESHPLDIKNPYSVAGSIANSLHTHLPNSISSTKVSSLPTNLSSFVFSGLTSTLKPHMTYAQSLDPKRFQQCDDIGYRDIGIDADVQCNVRFYMPQRILDKDPLAVALWMETEGYVETDTTTGLPEGYTPKNPNQDHSLAKDIILGQINSIVNTRSFGATEKAELFGQFLDFCVDRILPFGETYEDGINAFGSADDKFYSGEKCLETGDKGEHGHIFDYFRAYVFDQSVSNDLDESPIRENSTKRGGGARISKAQLLALIEEYGLEEPRADLSPELEVYGAPVKGYNGLLEQLTEGPNASKSMWAVESLLAAEKNFMDKGGDLKEYLTTAWLWLETGPSLWPDPYQINCDDSYGVNDVGVLCTPRDSNGVNMQTSGYRPIEKKDKYLEVYDKFYSDSELPTILQGVLNNSSNAASPIWDYGDSSQRNKHLVRDHLRDVANATLQDISPNMPILGPKTQFLSLMLGKDPNMTIGMNSYAVSDGDLIAALKGSGYGYIGTAHKQLLSNMIYSLWLFDSQYGGPEGGRGSGAGINAIWGGVGDRDISYGFNVIPNPSYGVNLNWYDYGQRHGMTRLAHTGTDIPGDPYEPVYSPVEGIIICEKNGVGSGHADIACNGAADLSVTGTDSSCPNLGRPGGAGTIMIKITQNGRETGDVLVLGHIAQSLVKLGQTVQPNQQVGTMGCMNGWHTHVEYYIPAPGQTTSGMRLVDPVEYLGR